MQLFTRQRVSEHLVDVLMHVGKGMAGAGRQLGKAAGSRGRETFSGFIELARVDGRHERAELGLLGQ